MPTASAPDGATIAYETTGAGPALILVHGITDSHAMWDPLIAPLAEDFKVVAVDLRGHGASERRPPYDVFTMAGDVHAVADAAHAINPLLVGHSLGGAVVTTYAATFPTRGVVNIDQSMQLGAFKDALTSIEPLLRGDDASFRAVMNQIVSGNYGPLAASERARIEAGTSLEQEVVLGVWDLVFSSSADELDVQVEATVGAITAPYSRVARRRSRSGLSRLVAHPHRTIDTRGLARRRPLPASRGARAVPRSDTRLRARRRRAMRVLVTTPSALGHVNPVIPLAQAFVRRGDDVLWATAPDSHPAITAAGLRAVAAGLEQRTRNAEYFGRYPEAHDLSPQDLPAHMFPRAFGEIAVPAMLDRLRTIADDWEPDMIVHGLGEFAAPIVAAARHPDTSRKASAHACARNDSKL